MSTMDKAAEDELNISNHETMIETQQANEPEM